MPSTEQVEYLRELIRKREKIIRKQKAKLDKVRELHAETIHIDDVPCCKLCRWPNPCPTLGLLEE